MHDLKENLSGDGKWEEQTCPLPLASIPRNLGVKVKRVSDLKGCSMEEALSHLVEKGLELFEREVDTHANTSRPSNLTPRQIAVLISLRSGLAVKEIADNLNVSEATVRTHIIRIRERTGCSDILKLRIP